MTQPAISVPPDPAVACLVVNADDFGLSRGVNAGIVQAHEQGIVSSATLMVHGDAAAEAAAYARLHPSLGLGLHVDLWESVLRNGEWVRIYQRCDETPEALHAEVQAQLQRFRDLVGREPDHLDTHQHVHRRTPVDQVLADIAATLHLPLRGTGGFGYLGGFYGQDGHGDPYPEGTTPERLVELIDALPRGQVTELSCHPADIADDDPLGGTMYRTGRNIERCTLMHASVRQRVARGDVRLGRFADFVGIAAAAAALHATAARKAA
jgi:predicted glycoside hydrolase/deacetylase ChbG (UPF0249 family)